MQQDYVALDLETTGLRPSEDRILEIGAIKVRNGEICERYSTLVDPGMPISPRIQELTGIDDAMAAAGKDSAAAVRELVAFCEDLPLLGHNILFDYSFIKRNAVNLGLPFEKQGIDTLKIARALLPDLEHKNLSYLCAYYQIGQEHAHRATDDALASMELYRRLAKEFPESPEELFSPKDLIFRVKKQGAITAAQKGYLNDLIKYHKISLSVRIETLTKNEASRIIDKIISEHGRILR